MSRRFVSGEPTSGVDPLARRALDNDQPAGGSPRGDHGDTHYLEEAEQCNRLGRMVAVSLSPRAAQRNKSRQSGHVIEFSRRHMPHRAAGPAEKTGTEALARLLVRGTYDVITEERPRRAYSKPQSG